MNASAFAGMALHTASSCRKAAGIPSTAGEYRIKEYCFASGEALPEVLIHYRTFGKPNRDPQGKVQNAVLILHGTGGDGESLMNITFAGELFGRRQPLDAGRYYIIIPDNLGHGKSTKPSDGLRARFPRYGRGIPDPAAQPENRRPDSLPDGSQPATPLSRGSYPAKG